MASRRSIKRTLRNDQVKNALKTFVVPLISDKYFVVPLRCLWDVEEKNLEHAALNLVNKSQQIEEIIDSFDMVVLYFSCFCAMESSLLRKRLLERKKKITADKDVEGSDTDNDYESYSDDNIIPGIELSFQISN